MFTKFLVVSSFVTVASMFGMWAAANAGAAEMPAPKSPACKIMYVNGDAVLHCARKPIVKISR